MLDVLDAAAVRRWWRTALDLLGRDRQRIDALNVFPVADSDTGTNLFLTVEAACEAADATAAGDPDDVAACLHDLARGAFIGARGNSGVILSQLLRGMADVVGAGPRVEGLSGSLLASALVRASRSADAAVAAPAEGTILTVARDVAAAVTSVPTDDLGAVVQRALTAADESLARTPDQMALLRRHGVVDAGGAGLVLLLRALAEVVTGVVPTPAARSWEAASHGGTAGWSVASPAPDPRDELATLPFGFEVMFLLDAPAAAIAELRSTLEPLGDSLLVVGGDELWNVHIHVDDVGAVLEAAMAVGRPHRIRVSHLSTVPEDHALVGHALRGECANPTRAVVLIVEGDGIAELARAHGATAIAAAAGSTVGTQEVLAALRLGSSGEVILVSGGDRFRSVADTAAQQARAAGVRVSVVPLRAVVQVLAALAVHDPARSFDDDVVAMTAAAGATRYAAATVAPGRAMTSVGVCEAGDVLGLVEGDVVLIGSEARDVAHGLLDRLLGGGGELVTVVHGEGGAGLAADVQSQLHDARPDVECVVYAAGATSELLLLGVE